MRHGSFLLPGRLGLQLLTFLFFLRKFILGLAQRAQRFLCLLAHAGKILHELGCIGAEFLGCVLCPDFCH